ncbi:MAG: hypothetical protein J5492_02620, partial [Oxalobacter sp.]|nr:hypothetical protein [Oxalobacter sp.]
VTVSDAIELATDEGNITIGKRIESTEGNIKATVAKAGNIEVGYTGQGRADVADAVVVDTVTAGKDITLDTALGKVLVKGGTASKAGDIHVAAASETYQAGETGSNIVIGLNGQVDAEQGGVSLEATKGDIVVTDKVKAVTGLKAVTVGQGNISFGTTVTVSDDIELATDTGNITIGRQIESTEGNIKATVAKAGNIEVGYTGQGRADVADAVVVDTVAAGKDITLDTALGKVLVKGGTASKAGDISIAAASETYQSGEAGSNIVIGLNGQVDAEQGGVSLKATKGDIVVTDKVHAVTGLKAVTVEKGDISFNTDVSVTGDINLMTEDGNITIGKKVHSTDGNILVEAAAKGVAAEKGEISIGFTGDDSDDTVYAAKDVTLKTGLGKVLINGGTTSGTGDISVSAVSKAYTEGAGSSNIIIYDHGDIDSRQGSVSLEATRGDIVITDKIHAAKDLNATTIDQGHISFGRDITVAGDVNLTTDTGDITAGGTVVAGGSVLANANTQGDIQLQEAVRGSTVAVSTQSGNVTVSDIEAL